MPNKKTPKILKAAMQYFSCAVATTSAQLKPSMDPKGQDCVNGETRHDSA